MRQLWYLPLLSLAMGLMMARTLVMAKILDIPNFAAFSAAQLVSSTFCMLGALGLQSLLQRDMPINFVQHRDRAATILLMQSLIITLACAVIAWIFTALGFLMAGLTAGFMFISILHGVSQQCFLLITVESRSRGETLLFARQTLERSVLVLVAGIATGLAFGSAAAVLLVEALVSIVLMLSILPGVLDRARIGAMTTFLLAVSRIRRLPWDKAMALLVLMSLSFAFLNADRWFAAELLSAHAFALYSFAWILLSVAQSVQAIINASAYPLLARRYSASGNFAAFRITAIISIALIILAALLFWPALYLVEASISAWFPTFLETKNIMGIFLLVAALRISDFWGSYLVIIGKEKLLLLIYGLIGVAVGSVWLYIVNPWVVQSTTIEAIAWLALSLTFFGYLAAFMTAYFFRRNAP